LEGSITFTDHQNGGDADAATVLPVLV